MTAVKAAVATFEAKAKPAFRAIEADRPPGPLDPERLTWARSLTAAAGGSGACRRWPQGPTTCTLSTSTEQPLGGGHGIEVSW